MSFFYEEGESVCGSGGERKRERERRRVRENGEGHIVAIYYSRDF